MSNNNKKPPLLVEDVREESPLNREKRLVRQIVGKRLRYDKLGIIKKRGIPW